MDVTLLGTGCPQVDPRRLGPASLVRHDGAALLVDCGSGVTQRLVSAGASGRALDAVFLTHLHSDHVVDLFQLVLSSWHQGRDRPMRVWGPPGTRAFVGRLMALWRPEIEQRIAHEKRPSVAALAVEVEEIGDGAEVAVGPLTVRAVAVRHPPVAEALGFVVAGAGRRVAFSGDTAYCPELIAAAAGCDVLVHECMIHRELPAVPGVRTAETLAAVASYHTLSQEVGRVAVEARAKCLMLNHFVPTRFDRAALLAEVRRDYAGPVIVGEDLMRLDLDSGALSVGDAVIGLPEGRATR
jgi:ribonuclease Z